MNNVATRTSKGLFAMVCMAGLTFTAVQPVSATPSSEAPDDAGIQVFDSQFAPNTAPLTASSSVAVEQEVIDAEELSATLQTMFEDVLVVDDEQGVVSYDEAAAIDLLGAESAGELGAQIAAASNAPTQSNRVATVSAARSLTFTECMYRNSVLGLVGGITGGVYTELIRERKWDELAQRLAPRLARAGVTGGAVGIAGSLGVTAVQCTFWND